MSDKYLNLTGLGTLWSKIKTKLAGKQDTLTFDSTPTANSTNPVTSSGIKTATDAKLNVDGTNATEAGTVKILENVPTGTATLSDLDNFLGSPQVSIYNPGQDVKTVRRPITDIWNYIKTKFGSVGSASQPVYFEDGVPTAGDKINNKKLTLKVGDTVIGDTFTANAGTDVTYTIPTSTIASSLTAGLDLKIDGTTVGVNANPKTGAIQGTYAFVEGDKTEASGASSHAEGGTTTASGACSHSEGCETTASGPQSHAEGCKTESTAENSHAEGAVTKANGTSSHAEGGGSIASGKDSHAEGFQSSSVGRVLKESGDITSPADWEEQEPNTTQSDTSTNCAQHAEGFQTKAGGIASHAEGRVTEAFGENSHAEGNATRAYGVNSHAEGLGSYVYGTTSHGEGLGTTINKSADASHAEGQGTKVTSGKGNHSEGYGAYTYTDDSGTVTTLANETGGYGCHAEGCGTYAASSGGSHAEGIADGANSDISYDRPGSRVTAGNYGSHAEGIGTTSTGKGSHAEGIDCVATGEAAHAEGKFTVANHPYQHVVGKYNEYNTSDEAVQYAEIVGGGTSNADRKNIRTLDWGGNEIISGNMQASNVVATGGMNVGGEVFDADSVKKWNQNAGIDTSPFELSGFVLAARSSAGVNTATYYPCNGSPVAWSGYSASKLIYETMRNCCRMNIQCATSMALSFGLIYNENLIGKSLKMVVSNTSNSTINIFLTREYDAANTNIRFINGVNANYGQSGIYDGQIKIPVPVGCCREIEFTILPEFTKDDNTTWSFLCLWNLHNYITVGSSTTPVYFKEGMPTAITSSISLVSPNEQSFVATHQTSGKSITLGVATGGVNCGIYDNTESKWMLYKDSSGAVHLGISSVGSGSIPIYLYNGAAKACTSLSSSLIAQLNRTPSVAYNTTPQTSSVTTTETTYAINYSDGTNWVGTRNTKSATDIACYFTNGTTIEHSTVLDTLHINRTGNVGVIYGYVTLMPNAAGYYVAKGNSTTKTTMRPYNCSILTIRGIPDLAGAIGCGHLMYTGDKLVTVWAGEDVKSTVIKFMSSVNFTSFAVGARFFFEIPLTFSSFN